MQGIIVHPGIVDADLTGQIHAMVSTPTLPVTIPEKTRIVQFIPFTSCVPTTGPKMQRDQGFGLTGEPQGFQIQVADDQTPNMMCTVTMPRARPSQVKVSGMIDTGQISPSTLPTHGLHHGLPHLWGLLCLVSEGLHRSS